MISFSAIMPMYNGHDFIVLVGTTTSIAHLDENGAALAGPPLGEEELAWLRHDRAPVTAESAWPAR